MKPHHRWRESTYEKILFMNPPHLALENQHSPLHGALKPVNFYLAAPQAGSVEIAGDFNHWHPLPMHRSIDGWWTTQIELPHGHHQYRFLVDGQPTLDPHATGSSRDLHHDPVSLIAVS